MEREKKRIPTCEKCQNQHYNFQVCPPRQDQKPRVEWVDSEGWGNKLQDLKFLGGNNYVQRREFDR